MYINDWKGKVEFVATNSFPLSRSFCFGFVKRASAEEGMGRFFGVKSGHL
jgi:hypothetical protein